MKMAATMKSMRSLFESVEKAIICNADFPENEVKQFATLLKKLQAQEKIRSKSAAQTRCKRVPSKDDMSDQITTLVVFVFVYF